MKDDRAKRPAMTRLRDARDSSGPLAVMRLPSAITSTAVIAFCATLAPAAAVQAETLAQALARAYQTNPQLRAARATLRSVNEQAAQAYSNWRPSVSISADAGRSAKRDRTRGEGFRGDRRSPAGASVNLSQNVFRGGRSFHQWRQAKYNIFAQRARLANVEQTVLVSVVRAYMDVFRDRAVLRLNKNNERVLARQLQATRDRFSVGEVTRTDVSQAQARLAQARASTIQALGNLQASRANYVNVVGHLPNRVRSPRVRVILPRSARIIVQRARRHNPQVVAALWDERSARAGVKIIAGELLPTVTINGQVQRRFDSLGRETTSDSASITANVTIPLYQSGAVTSRMRAAKQTVFQRLNELRQAQRTAVENATRSYAALRTARSSVQAFVAQLKANRIALNGVRQEAAAGLRTVLDTLDAQQELLNAQVNLVRARRDLVVATYELLAAIGQMNAKKLRLRVKYYDPKKHYRKVRYKAYGFGKKLGSAPSLGK